MQHKYYLERLQSMLSDKRLKHSLGVSATAAYLAELYGADREQAEVAGLLHDCARDMTGGELLALARENNLPVDEVEVVKPTLLHAQVGAMLARRQLGVLDYAVLRAIEVHTLGDVTMTLLDKVLFVADKTEPGRKTPGVDELRQIAAQNLDQALSACFDAAIVLSVHKGELIHPRTVQARNRANILSLEAGNFKP